MHCDFTTPSFSQNTPLSNLRNLKTSKTSLGNNLAISHKVGNLLEFIKHFKKCTDNKTSPVHRPAPTHRHLTLELLSKDNEEIVLTKEDVASLYMSSSSSPQRLMYKHSSGKTFASIYPMNAGFPG